ncbi:MAG TPA: ATP-binding protein [Anaerolineales bacterium]|nr:ATP-binding protein [Anaerolineales bacterium]
MKISEVRDKITAMFLGPRFRFVWQLMLAFMVIIFLAGGGMLFAGRFALYEMASYVRENPPAMVRPRIENLGRYYAAHGSWEGVDTLMTEDSYKTSGGLIQDLDTEYVIAAPNGTIVSASDKTRVGRPLRDKESAIAMPIVVDGQTVGYFLLSLYGSLKGDYHLIVDFISQRFRVVGLCVVATALLASIWFSRLISLPVIRLMDATQTVAAGDLNVHVHEQYPGELGELAKSFNRMTAELARANELRRNLTADLAHELRTPLSVIRGKIEGVLDGVYPATPQHLEPILEEIRLLSHLVEDLNLLALAEAGQLDLEKQALDIGDLVRDAQVNFGPQADDRGVTLALDLPAGSLQVMADRRRISQILGNLLTNALRHTPQGGYVTLSAAMLPRSSETGKGSVMISVSDTGAGILPKDLPYIFERFWRGEKSRSRAGGGSGLGLAIARQLVEMHGGEISVESTPSIGSTFKFVLPVL